MYIHIHTNVILQVAERLVECGWKPHRDFLARKKQSPAPFYT